MVNALPRFRRYRLTLLGLLALLPLALLLGAGLGAYPIPPLAIPGVLLKGEGVEYQVLTALRFPRVLGAALVGGLLALSGAVLQGLFRNPLVDPGLIGVSSGAALGAAVFIVLLPGAGPLETYALPFFAFLGGLSATRLLWRLAQTPLGVQVSVLLLAGLALNALVGAGIGLLTFLATEEELRSLTFWMLGGFSALTWRILLTGLPLAFLAFLLLFPLGRGLNALALGEREAFHLGVDLEHLKRWAVAGAALGVGVAVAVKAQGEALEEVRIGVTGAGYKAFRLTPVEERLKAEGLKALEEALGAYTPEEPLAEDRFASAEYRLHLLKVLTRRALAQALA